MYRGLFLWLLPVFPIRYIATTNFLIYLHFDVNVMLIKIKKRLTKLECVQMTNENDRALDGTPQLNEHFKASHGADTEYGFAAPFHVTDVAQLKALAAHHQIAPLAYIKLLESLAFAQQAEIRASHLRIEELGGELATVSDKLTEEREARAAAEVAQRLDGLTGLGNRKAFNERLAGVLAENDSDGDISIAYLDIDGLKQTNDNYGHHVGDKLLLAATKLFQERLRGDDEIFRVGGDEVTMLMSGKRETIEKRMLKMQSELETMQIRANIAGEWKNIPIWGFSFGVHTIDRGQSAEANYEAADSAMYLNKKQRKEDQKDLRAGRLATMLEDKAKQDSYTGWSQQTLVANDMHSIFAPTLNAGPA